MTFDEFRENRVEGYNIRERHIVLCVYNIKKGLGEEKYEFDCAETAAREKCSRCRSHRVCTLHVARTRYYIIIKVYMYDV